MAYVPIPKDLKRVKTKVAFNLTKRQLIGFSIAGFIYEKVCTQRYSSYISYHINATYIFCNLI